MARPVAKQKRPVVLQLDGPTDRSTRLPQGIIINQYVSADADADAGPSKRDVSWAPNPQARPLSMPYAPPWQQPMYGPPSYPWVPPMSLQPSPYDANMQNEFAEYLSWKFGSNKQSSRAGANQKPTFEQVGEGTYGAAQGNKKRSKASSKKTSNVGWAAPADENDGWVDGGGNDNGGDDNWEGQDEENGEDEGWAREAADGQDNNDWNNGDNNDPNAGGWDDNNNNNNASWENNVDSKGNNNNKQVAKSHVTKQAADTKAKSASHASTKSAKSEVNSMLTLDPDKPYTKAYWSNWNQHSRSKSSLEPIRESPKEASAARAQRYPAPPRNNPTPSIVGRAKLSHQLAPQRGAAYQHRTGTPDYIDSFDAPYATFVFKYRSNKKLEEILGDNLKEAKIDRGAYRDRMMSAKKEDLVEEVMRLKKAHGYDTDDSVGTSLDEDNGDQQ